MQVIEDSKVRLCTESGMEKQLHATMCPAQPRSRLLGELGLPTTPATGTTNAPSHRREAEHPLSTSHPKASGQVSSTEKPVASSNRWDCGCHCETHGDPFSLETGTRLYTWSVQQLLLIPREPPWTEHVTLASSSQKCMRKGKNTHPAPPPKNKTRTSQAVKAAEAPQVAGNGAPFSSCF